MAARKLIRSSLALALLVSLFAGVKLVKPNSTESLSNLQQVAQADPCRRNRC
ncbi:hypothetical protein [Bradyrhizobium sp.]|jgi:hypothetical protein|uniref:hypothetical protein n=1 Tax=Bradyrhizobium sp. TaxID=376 RepID=UPI002DFBEA2D|nr:hypothetical protein [Bradyrhizobium sp.]